MWICWLGSGLEGVFHSLRIAMSEKLGIAHTSVMDTSTDPYARLATLLWILKPADVARLVDVADGLAEQRLVAFLGSAGSQSGQSPPGPQKSS